jgi:hypothetical protein
MCSETLPTSMPAFPVLVLLRYLYTDTPLATAIRGLPVSLRTHLKMASYNPPKPCANYKLSGSRGLRLEALDALCGAVAQRVPPPLLNTHFSAFLTCQCRCRPQMWYCASRTATSGRTCLFCAPDIL